HNGFSSRIKAHDVHFSFGEDFSSSMPETEFEWWPTRQPIVLSEWQPSAAFRDAFTTIMNWTSYKPLKFRGHTYAQKDLELRRFLQLPQEASSETFEIALNKTHHITWQAPDDSADSAVSEATSMKVPPATMLRRMGWQVVDAVAVCGGLDTY